MKTGPVTAWRIRRHIDAGTELPAELRQRVADDPELRARLERERSLAVALHREAPEPVPTPGLAERIIADLDRRPARRLADRRNWMPALAAAMGLALAAWFGLGRAPTVEEAPRLAAASESATAVSIGEAQAFLDLLTPRKLPVWLTADQVDATATSATPANPFTTEAEALRDDTRRLAGFLVECLPGGLSGPR